MHKYTDTTDQYVVAFFAASSLDVSARSYQPYQCYYADRHRRHPHRLYVYMININVNVVAGVPYNNIQRRDRSLLDHR